MKFIKQLVMAFSFFTFFTVSCQTNELNLNSIKIGNINFQEILNTKGDKTKVETLLGSGYTFESGDLPGYWLKYRFGNILYLKFDDGEYHDNGIIDDYQLTNLEIFDPSVSLTINGKVISIGDKIGKLGKPDILSYPDGKKEIVYKVGVQVFEIGYNPTNNTITKIKYVCYN